MKRSDKKMKIKNELKEELIYKTKLVSILFFVAFGILLFFNINHVKILKKENYINCENNKNIFVDIYKMENNKPYEISGCIYEINGIDEQKTISIYVVLESNGDKLIELPTYVSYSNNGTWSGFTAKIPLFSRKKYYNLNNNIYILYKADGYETLVDCKKSIKDLIKYE